jgi:Family of unknown function (DUF6294)
VGDVGNTAGEEVKPQAQEAVEPQAHEEEVERTALADQVELEALERLELATKNFTWGVLSKGDCFCRHAALTLYSDGLGHFTAWTSTTSSGDVWLFKGLALLGFHGDELYRIGQFNGPRMELTNYDYFVIRARQTNPLVFPQQLFPIVHSVRMHYHC